MENSHGNDKNNHISVDNLLRNISDFFGQYQAIIENEVEAVRHDSLVKCKQLSKVRNAVESCSQVPQLITALVCGLAEEKSNLVKSVKHLKDELKKGITEAEEKKIIESEFPASEVSNDTDVEQLLIRSKEELDKKLKKKELLKELEDINSVQKELEEIAIEANDLQSRLEITNNELQKTKLQADECSSEAREAEKAFKELEEEVKVIKEKRKLEEERKKEEERKRIQEEKRLADIRKEEEKKREEEQRLTQLSDSWNEHSLYAENEFGESVMVCILLTRKFTFVDGDIIADFVDNTDLEMDLLSEEEAISRTISLTLPDEKRNFTNGEIKVCIPHVHTTRNQWRESFVKVQDSEKRWTTIQATDKTFPSKKNLTFSEVNVRTFGNFMAISRLKVDTFNLQQTSVKLISSADARMGIACPPNLYKKVKEIKIKITPLDSSAIQDIKHRYAEESSSLLSCSNILSVMSPVKAFSKSLDVSLPLPTYGQTGRESVPTHPGKRSSNFHGTRESEPRLVLLHNDEDDNDKWAAADDVNITLNKKKDGVVFPLDKPYKRMVVVRLKCGTAPTEILPVLKRVVTSVERKAAYLILGQRNDDPGCVRVVCCLKRDAGSTEDKLIDAGFGENVQKSPQFEVKEGEKFEVRLRENVQFEEPEGKNIFFKFFSQMKDFVEFEVSEIDLFAQQSFASFMGITQVFTKKLTQQQVQPSDSDKDKKKPKFEFVLKDFLVSELLIILPKPMFTPNMHKETHFRFKGDKNCLNEDLIYQLVSGMSDEWKLLATYLGISDERVQDIERNNPEGDAKACAQQTLWTWGMRANASADQAGILKNSLTCIGRTDLAEIVHKANEDYRGVKEKDLEESNFQKAAIRIAKSSYLSARWQVFGRRLGLTEQEVTSIAQKGTTRQDCCLECLLRYRKKNKASATTTSLHKLLMRLGLTKEADDIRFLKVSS